MAAQKSELEFISVERPIAKRQTQTSQSSKYKNTRTKRHNRKYRRRQRKNRCIFTVSAFLILFLAIWGIRSKLFSGTSLLEKEQMLEKMNAEDYPEELKELLEKNEETLDYIKDYPNREYYINQQIDLSKDYKSGEIPLLIQWDKRWGYDMYGDSMIGLSGCGPTCMTMAYLYFTGDLQMNPKRMAEYAENSGYHTTEGTSWSFWTEGAANLGLYGESLSLSENTMKAALDSGALIVCSMGPGDFTDQGHFILIRGYDENGFYVNDPNRRSNSRKQWDYETISSQIKNLWMIDKV